MDSGSVVLHMQDRAAHTTKWSVSSWTCPTVSGMVVPMQLNLLHRCDTAGNEITYLPGGAKIPTPVHKQLMGKGYSVPGLSAAFLGQHHEGRVAGRWPAARIDPHVTHKYVDGWIWIQRSKLRYPRSTGTLGYHGIS